MNQFDTNHSVTSRVDLYKIIEWDTQSGGIDNELTPKETTGFLTVFISHHNAQPQGTIHTCDTSMFAQFCRALYMYEPRKPQMNQLDIIYRVTSHAYLYEITELNSTWSGGIDECKQVELTPI